MSVKSVAAIENFHAIGEKYLKGNYELKIVDVGVEREKAIEFQIVAIPTLIRTHPMPSKTIVGDLSDVQKVLNYLGIES
ncbi:MAG: circadian clock protein KaiB [Flavobacterium sp.]|nr:MAG: circadian clock protein KaiB [Flavobacterium sp.]